MAHDISENTGNLINQGVPEDQAPGQAVMQVLGDDLAQNLISGSLKALGLDDTATKNILSRLPNHPVCRTLANKIRDAGYGISAEKIDQHLQGMLR